MTHLRSNTSRQSWLVSSLPGSSSKDAVPTSTSSVQPKIPPIQLVLHFDINETILLGDEAGGDSRHDSVQKMLAKSAFCQLPTTTTSSPTSGSPQWEDTLQASPTHWWDGQVMGRETSLPPLYTGWAWPPGCCPYYRTAYKKYSKKFVDEHHGKIYKSLLEECERELAKNTASNHILPAFYHTLESLVKQNADFRLVFRTFGSDIQEIAQVVTDFAQGKHPDYPDFKCSQLELPQERLFQGRWKCVADEHIGSKENPFGYIYELWDAEETTVVASGDEEILNFLKHHPICGIRDDYQFWKKNGWDPTAGKPIWIPSYTPANGADNGFVYEHHLLFDDNIHNLAHDGIGCARMQAADGSYYNQDGATMHQKVQGVHMLRVPTVEPVLNPRWYLEQIALAQDKLQERLIHGALTSGTTTT